MRNTYCDSCRPSEVGYKFPLTKLIITEILTQELLSAGFNFVVAIHMHPSGIHR
jgi:hypothetical protein